MIANIYFFFFNDTATTEIYTLSLHDALPIWTRTGQGQRQGTGHALGVHFVSVLIPVRTGTGHETSAPEDRKSTRLNSSHVSISYAVFCLKKKNNNIKKK